MNITESNALIADFMGWDYSDEDEFYFTPHSERVIDEYDSIDGNHVYDNELPVDLLKFHSSWDWLMPVLDKIKDICFSDEWGENYDSEYFYDIRDCVPDIDHTYKAVVQFIKRYNETLN